MQIGTQQRGQGTCKLSVAEEGRLHGPEVQNAGQQLPIADESNRNSGIALGADHIVPATSS